MNILVTGASGFVGRHVIRQLLADGHTVTATGTQPTLNEPIRYIPYTLPLAGDERDLFRFFGRPDALIHLAWQGLPNYMATFHFEQNLFPQYLFLKNLIQNGLQNLTVAGTCFEYGLQNGELNETQTPTPQNPYAQAKDMLRQLLTALQAEHTYSLKWARLFYLYGEGQNPNALLPQLERAIRAGEATFRMSGGEQLRDYLPVTTAAYYLCRMATQTQTDGIINCCSGQPISVRRLVENYIQEQNANIKPELGFYPYAAYEPMAFWGNIEKLSKIIAS